MVLVIDNYDSFTYNLVQYLGELGADVRVLRNDAASLEEVVATRPDRVVISPGPGRPEQAGVTMSLIRALGQQTPILGVCLGHQAIAQAYGGRITRAPSPMHGKLSRIRHTGEGVFRNIPNEFEVTRYHSLTVDPSTVPNSLTVTAMTSDGVIMGIMHRQVPVHGVQFHPESIASEHGHALLRNFLDLARSPVAA